MTAWKAGLASAVLAGVAGCGGGGGGDGPPPNDFPYDPLLLSARSAGVKATSTPATGKAELAWQDWFTEETGFRVDKWVNGAWTPVATLPASPGMKQMANWTAPLEAVSTPYRVVALLATPREDGSREIALSGADESTLLLGTTSANAAISVSAADPLKGEAKLRITDAPEALSVHYLVDGRDVQPTAASPTAEVPWNTASVANGSHTLTAFVAFGPPGSYKMLSRTVNVAN